MQCIRCGSKARRDGQTRLGGQRWRCSRCGRRFTPRSTSAFSRRCFPEDLIALAVRWYVRYRLSYADVTEWLAERGIVVDRSTVYRWVQRFLPLFAEATKPSKRYLQQTLKDTYYSEGRDVGSPLPWYCQVNTVMQ